MSSSGQGSTFYQRLDKESGFIFEKKQREEAMKSKLFKSICMMAAMTLFVSQLQVSVFAAETDRDLTLDEGVINLKPSNDTDDFNYFSTASGLPGLFWDGVLSYSNDPGIRINSSG